MDYSAQVLPLLPTAPDSWRWLASEAPALPMAPPARWCKANATLQHQDGRRFNLGAMAQDPTQRPDSKFALNDALDGLVGSMMQKLSELAQNRNDITGSERIALLAMVREATPETMANVHIHRDETGQLAAAITNRDGQPIE